MESAVFDLTGWESAVAGPYCEIPMLALESVMAHHVTPDGTGRVALVKISVEQRDLGERTCQKGFPVDAAALKDQAVTTAARLFSNTFFPPFFR